MRRDFEHYKKNYKSLTTSCKFSYFIIYENYNFENTNKIIVEDTI